MDAVSWWDWYHLYYWVYLGPSLKDGLVKVAAVVVRQVHAC